MAQQSEAGHTEQPDPNEQSQKEAVEDQEQGNDQSEQQPGQVVPPLADEEADNQQADPRAE